MAYRVLFAAKGENLTTGQAQEIWHALIANELWPRYGLKLIQWTLLEEPAPPQTPNPAQTGNSPAANN